jgi:chromosome segregation ATPase
MKKNNIMDIQPSIQRLADDVSSLQQNMAKFGSLVDRLDITIDKLTEVSTSVSQLLAVHESKLTAQEEYTRHITELVERRRVDTDDKIKAIGDRIIAGEKDIQNKLDNQYDALLEEIKAARKDSADEHKELVSRISKVEKWSLLVIGGAMVVGFILSKINFAGLF